MVKDCVKNCITHTFDFLFANCDEVYKRESKQNSSAENPQEQNEETTPTTTTTTSTIVVTPSLKSLEFWHQLMYLLSRIISEDRERYSLVLNQFVFRWNVSIHFDLFRLDFPLNWMLDTSVQKRFGNFFPMNCENISKVHLRFISLINRHRCLFCLEHARISAERREIKSPAYMKLHFQVKQFYDKSVRIIPEARNSVPEYPK